MKKKYKKEGNKLVSIKFTDPQIIQDIIKHSKTTIYRNGVKITFPTHCEGINHEWVYYKTIPCEYNLPAYMGDKSEWVEFQIPIEEAEANTKICIHCNKEEIN